MLTSGPGARWRLAAAALVAMAGAIGLATVRDYGVTWDEEHSMRQGELLYEWYASGFKDRRVIDEEYFRFYGGFFNVLVQLVHRAGAPLYEAAHALTLAFGLSGLALAYGLGASISSPLGGFLSALFLWLTPLYYGHSFNNPKDLPFAVLSLAALAALRWCWGHLPDPPRRVWLAAGIAIGTALAVRIAGVILLGYLLLAWVAWLALHGNAAGNARRMAMAGVKIAALAWFTMVLFFPWGQVEPLHAPWQALQASKAFTVFRSTVLFAGADLSSHELPWSYLPVWFGITLPEFYAIAAALALVPPCRLAAKRQPAAIDRTRAVFFSLLAVAVLFPVALAIATKAILYDANRLFLFVVPPLAVLAGAGASFFFAGAESRIARGAAAFALAAGVSLTALDMWHLHPYQSVYFNRSLGGGLKGAQGRFETDYWGQSYGEAANWLVANYRPQGARRTRVANCSTPFLTRHYLEASPGLRARFETVELGQSPDIVLATTRWNCHKAVPGRVLHVVKRMNAPLCYVIEVDRARFVPPAIAD